MKKSVEQALKRPLRLAHSLAVKKVIKQFAHKFEFVYFGYVNHQEDEHELVRGITAAVTHHDDHFTVGNFRGRDVTLVERQDTLTFPGKPAQSYRWIIMQLDLKQDGIPHMFIDAHHHDEVFYANVFVKHKIFENAASQFMQHDPQFTKYFKIFAPTNVFDELQDVLTPEITAMLSHHFKQFDYELFEDRLLIYASNAVVTLGTLQEMLRVGIWLAERLDKRQTDM